MTASNPFEPSPIIRPKKSQLLPHSRSIRTEAWRGAKFGAKISAIAMTAIVLIVTLVITGMFAYVVIATEGEILQEVDMFEMAKSIGNAVTAIAAMTLLGGVTGALVMSAAACLRKRRIQSNK